MGDALGSALGRLTVPVLTCESGKVLNPYNEAARRLFVTEGLRSDLIEARPSHPWARFIRSVFDDTAPPKGRAVVVFPSGSEYSIEVSRPSARGTERWLVLLVTRLDDAAPLPHRIEGWGFTEREKEIAEQLATGAGSDQICETLGIARSTLKTHLASMFTKTGSRSRTELLARLLRSAT